MSILSAYRRAVPYVLGLYIVAVVAAFIYFNIRLSVEWVAIVLFVAAILSGRALLFLRDWGVFIAALLAWQTTEFLATDFHFPYHLTDLIAADRFLTFGHEPTIWLQSHLYHPGVVEPWDVFASSMYLMHFVAPLVSGFILWMVDRAMFRKFAVAFILVALAGFATYIMFPAVPPWMAGEHLVRVGNTYVKSPQGHVYLPGVKNLFNLAMGHWYNASQGTIFFGGLHLHYDKVAAFPSEHAMYPMLFFLFLRRQFGRLGYIALAYVGGIVFSIVYLGQHYVIDAVAGIAYAIVGYVVVMHLAPAVARWWATRRDTVPALGLLEPEEA